MRVSAIRVKRILVNQGLGVLNNVKRKKKGGKCDKNNVNEV